MKDLKDKLQKINDALTYVPQHLDISEVKASLRSSSEEQPSNHYSEAIKEVSREISSRIIHAMDAVINSIRGSHFYEANQTNGNNQIDKINIGHSSFKRSYSESR